MQCYKVKILIDLNEFYINCEINRELGGDKMSIYMSL